jgi:predicted P-loop ATPase
VAIRSFTIEAEISIGVPRAVGARLGGARVVVLLPIGVDVLDAAEPWMERIDTLRAALRGKLIYEIAEMGALVRSEEKRQKSFLSRTTDEYRPVYGRREIKAPRQVVFAGSTNEFEWNKDPTGGRRFWAVECEGAFDLDGLRSVRDQLFAEAYAAVLSGEINYPSAEEQREIFDPEQLKIEMQEGLIDWIHDWVHAQVSDFSMADVVSQCLKLDASKLTRDLQTRLGTALKKLGCGRAEKRNGMIRRWYKPPERNEASSKPVTSRPDWEDDDVPL